ncbi:MAG: hypothetical protein M1135_03505 [Candidatus Omnitrophica bacterium]|jgi:hypothetical protein|nr:hypothetical protein [Candidatus Omnitrophota bacterium]
MKKQIMKKYLMLGFLIMCFNFGTWKIYSADINFPVLNLPATPGQLEEASSSYPDLINWSGNMVYEEDQSMLLNEKLPLVRLKNCVWADKLTGRPLRILIVSTLQIEGDLMYFPSAFPADWVRIPAYYGPSYQAFGLPPEVMGYSLNFLKKAFAQHPDVIIPTISEAPFPSDVHKFILKYVKDNGAGLILCGLDYYGWDGTWWDNIYGKESPLSGNGGERQIINKMSSIISTDYPSFGGVPFAIFPPINVYENIHLVNNGVPVWSTNNGVPLVAMEKYGKGKIIATGWFAGEYFEKNLQVSDGQQLGQIIFQTGYKNCIPCFVYKKHGKGQALLLNFLLSAYTRAQDQWSNLLGQQILRLAGVKPSILVSNKEGVPLQGFELTRWRDKNAEYFGIFRRKDSSPLIPSNVYLFFKKPGWTYLIGGENPIKGKIIPDKYLGYSRKVKIKLAAGGVILIARLPYKIEKLDAKLMSDRKSFWGANILVHLITSGNNNYSGSIVPYVVHVSVFNPSGVEEGVLRRNVVLHNGKAIIPVHLFLNAPKGQWKIILREIVSGKKAEVSFKI